MTRLQLLGLTVAAALFATASVHAEGERVILTSGDGRQEIDLLPPRPATETSPTLPVPVCPNGVVSTTGDGFEEPPAPGESNLDEGLDHLSEPPLEGGAL